MTNDFYLKKAAYYYYGLLSDKNKKLYETVLRDILAHKSKTDVSGKGYTVDSVNLVIEYITFDRPDIFWCIGNTVYSRSGMLIEIEYSYCYTQNQVNVIINEILNSSFYKQLNIKMTAAKNSFERALVLYEYIIQHCEYDNQAANSNMPDRYRYAFTLQGVMVKGRAVCSGYAKTFQYFANKYEIYCTYVSGKTVRGSHGWNLIKLGGEYYYIDATWGDPTFTNTAQQDPDYVSYDFFCFTTADLLKTHRPVLKVNMPACTATAYNYYVYYGLYATSYSSRDIASRISRALAQRKNEINIKYSSATLYNSAKARLFDGQEIYAALRTAGVKRYGYSENSIRYLTNDDRCTLTIILKRI